MSQPVLLCHLDAPLRRVEDDVMYVPIYRIDLVRERHVPTGCCQIRDPEAAAAVVRDYLCGRDREEFVVVGLSTKSTLIGISTVSVGSLDCTIVHPREVYKPAILMNAASLIVAHNHPSGDPTPSPEDLIVTTRLAQAGETLGIELMDHLIIGEPDFLSFRCQGWLPVGSRRAAKISGGCLERVASHRPTKVRELGDLLTSLFDETFLHESPDGTLRAWNVTVGNQVAATGHDLMRFHLLEQGATPERIMEVNPDIEPEYAMTQDLEQPLLFILFGEEALLIDGWHRLYKAAALRIEKLPMYLLTQQEANRICWLVLPPGHGVKWRAG